MPEYDDGVFGHQIVHPDHEIHEMARYAGWTVTSERDPRGFPERVARNRQGKILRENGSRSNAALITCIEDAAQASPVADEGRRLALIVNEYLAELESPAPDSTYRGILRKRMAERAASITGEQP